MVLPESLTQVWAQLGMAPTSRVRRSCNVKKEHSNITHTQQKPADNQQDTSELLTSWLPSAVEGDKLMKSHTVEQMWHT